MLHVSTENSLVYVHLTYLYHYLKYTHLMCWASGSTRLSVTLAQSYDKAALEAFLKM